MGWVARSIVITLRSVNDPKAAKTRSSWIYEGLVRHPQDWLHGQESDDFAAGVPKVAARHIAMLLPSVHGDVLRHRAHAEWLEQDVIIGLVPGSLSIVDRLVGHARDMVRRWRDGSPAEHAMEMVSMVADAQPESIRARLIADDAFLAECGIPSENWIRFGNGVAVSRSDLVRAARDRERTGERQTITGEGASRWWYRGVRMA